MKKLKGKAMRKTLLASAALIVMGGGAYAEVSVTGAGNFGVKFDGSKSGSEALTFHHEFDVKFTASGTTDGGLTFGGSVGIDDRESTTGTAMITTTTEGVGHAIMLGDTTNICFVSTEDKGAAIYTRSGVTDNFVYARGKELDAPWSRVKSYIGTDFHDLDDDENTVDNSVYINDEGKTVPTPEDGGNIMLRPYNKCKDIVFVEAVTSVTAKTTGANDNNASVHIGFDVHTLTIGDGLDAGDVAAGGVADVGFDGIGVDDVAKKLRGGTNVDVVYTGSFGVANVRVSSGGDDHWGVGFNFNVAPVTIGVGFDSKKVASIGLGLAQGPVSGKLLYSTASEDDKKAYGAEIGYTISEGTSVTIVYSQLKDPMGGADEDAVGFGFSHGLGGGATLAAGIGQVNDETKADLGITMTF